MCENLGRGINFGNYYFCVFFSSDFRVMCENVGREKLLDIFLFMFYMQVGFCSQLAPYYLYMFVGLLMSFCFIRLNSG